MGLYTGGYCIGNFPIGWNTTVEGTSKPYEAKVCFGFSWELGAGTGEEGASKITVMPDYNPMGLYKKLPGTGVYTQKFL